MEDVDYCEITSQLDAREILRYLNSMGISNISGEVLKHFITDLKKLIKYDLHHRQNKKLDSELPGPERLHSASTFSSRNRSRAQGETVSCCRVSHKPKAYIRSSYSSPNLGQNKASVEQKEDKGVPKRSCSCIRIDKKQETARKESTVTTGSNNLIKVPKQPIKRKCDPVSLYHYYTSLWSKYKPNVPGENDWAELRWNIRQKMVGRCDVPTLKVPELKNKNALHNKK